MKDSVRNKLVNEPQFELIQRRNMRPFRILLGLTFIALIVQYSPTGLPYAQPSPSASNLNMARELIEGYDESGNVEELDQAIHLLEEELSKLDPESPMVCDYYLSEARVKRGLYWFRQDTTETGRSAAEAQILEDLRSLWSKAAKIDEYPDTTTMSLSGRLGILDQTLFSALMEAGQDLEHANSLAPLMKSTFYRAKRYTSIMDTLSIKEPFVIAREFIDLDYPNVRFISCAYGADDLGLQVWTIKRKIAHHSAMIDSLRRLASGQSTELSSHERQLDSLKQIDLEPMAGLAAPLAVAAEKASRNDKSEYIANCLAAQNLEIVSPRQAVSYYYRALSARHLVPNTAKGYLGYKFNNEEIEASFQIFLRDHSLKLLTEGKVLRAVDLLRDGFNVQGLARYRKYNLAIVLSKALRMLINQFQSEGKSIDQYTKERDRVDTFINAYELSIERGS
ncbi:MAG: hypothetical protein KAW16_07445 [candidate division Zixibacteria bacterium]|nr:hypothetical protein [candidate division Zixibacteria bacterium]